MSQKALAVLDYIIREKSTRENRSTDLLKEPHAESTEGWYMHVPSCFHAALDIKLTERKENGKSVLVWTQGSFFSFKTGDILYDTSDINSSWPPKHMNLCLQVQSGANAGTVEGKNERFPGFVTISIHTPDREKNRIIARFEYTFSQDEFVRFLIAGPQGELKEKIERNQN